VPALLVTLPAPLATVTVKSARLSAIVVGGVVYDEEFAPLIAVPFFCHWKLSGVVPVTVTEKVAVCPAVTSALTGSVVIAGAAPAAVATLRVAGLLVILPRLLATTTVNSGRLTETVVGGVVYDEELAPPIAVPFFCHWKRRGAVPVAVTEKVAVCPAVTSALTGSVVIAGSPDAPPNFAELPVTAAHPDMVRHTTNATDKKCPYD
jgi:hypothetical protein